MTALGLFVLGILFGSFVTWWIIQAQERFYAADTLKGKRMHLVMALVEEKERVTNDDVEELLEVSDATAERYLEQLEEAGIIKQMGRTGKFVYYTKA